MSYHQYVLTETVAKRLEGRGLILSCCRCDESLKVGEEITSKVRGQRFKKFYCKKCWKSLFY